MRIDEFATAIIEGDGGLNEYARREWVSWPYSDRIAASVWTMRCLANPDCKNSDVALAAILRKRREQLPAMTLDRASELWQETDYAHEAVEPDDNKINSGDAAAFFLEGYEYARRMMVAEKAGD